MHPDPSNLLYLPIAELPLSTELKSVAARHCFHSLAELSGVYMSELLALPGFDHRLWNEFAEFLEMNGHGYLLNKKSPPRE